MSFQIQWKGTPNFRKGRKGYSPIAIVDHQTAGKFPGCLNWMMNSQAQASSHYLINRQGEIFQLVKDEDTAWANGGVNKPTWNLYNGVNPNLYTLSIEHECYPEVGGNGNLTDIQYQATVWLHKYLIDKWNIPIDREHIIGHFQIDSVDRPNCPGSAFPWDKLMQDLNPQPIYTPVNIQVNGQLFQGVASNNISYAPVRVIAEKLGQTVQWDSAGNTVYIGIVPVYYPYTKNIKIAIGNITIDAVAINNISYAPVRDFAEALGKTVNWDGKQVIIQ